MSSPLVNLHKALSTESLNIRYDTNQQRISLQHIFNSCVLDKYQRVNAGELVRHFRFVAEQNADLLCVPLDFAFLLNQLGGSDQQVSFEQLFNAVENLYSQLIQKSNTSTPISKSISSTSLQSSLSLKKKKNKENIDTKTNDDVSFNLLESRRKSQDYEICKAERDELIENNRRQAECLRMLEEEYKKLDDEHQRLQNQYEDIQKKKISLEDDLNRSSRYVNENIDLHMHKNQLENSYRDLKVMNEYCEREKFELQEQLIDMENQIQNIRDERDKYMARLIDAENELSKEINRRENLEAKLNITENQLKENNHVIHSLQLTIDELNLVQKDMIRQNATLENSLAELREQLRSAKTESIEARLSLSNLCDEESFLCDELEERVDVSRRITISNGQSLFAEINTINNISNECISQYLDSSNVENIDDMEVRILLSKTDSFNSNYLKDVFHELHANGINISEQLNILLEQIKCEPDRENTLKTLNFIEKYFVAIKNLIKKIIDNKDVFEGRFRKLQTLLIATREKQQKFQNELTDFSNSIQLTLTPTNAISMLKDYYYENEELKRKERIFEEKIHLLEEQILKLRNDEKAQRLKCTYLNKQIKKLHLKSKDKREQNDDNVSLLRKRNRSSLTTDVCPFHSVRELLRDDDDLFNSTSSLLPCRCLNRSRSNGELTESKLSMDHFRRLSSPCSSIPSANTITTIDSGLNTSTGCTTSRSLTPDLHDDISTTIFEIDSELNPTLIENNKLFNGKARKKHEKSTQSISFRNSQTDRIKRVLKRLKWCAILTGCTILLFLWSVVIRYYCLTSPNDDDCNRLSFAWWPFAYCSTNGITL